MIKTSDDFLNIKCDIQASDADCFLYNIHNDGKLQILVMNYLNDILLMYRNTVTLRRKRLSYSKDSKQRICLL